MNYVETEIDELLSCPFCRDKYDDPRIIECENSLCMPCIELLSKNSSNGFQCPVCDEFHEQPKKGFLKNTTLAKLCEKRANRVYRSPLADTVDAQLSKLKRSIKKLAHENDLGADEIGEYWDRLRNEVQLHLEELTESLKKQSLELIQKIDEYENETKIKFVAKYNLRLDSFLSEARQFHEKWADYLKQYEINEEELKLASREAKKLQNKLNKESDLLPSKVFHFNPLKFEKSTPPDFGSLIDDGVKQSYTQSLASLKSFNLGTKINCENISKYSIKPLSNGNISIAYSKHNDAGLWIEVCGNNLSKPFQKRIQKYSVYREFQLVELNQAIVLCLSDIKTGTTSFSTFLKYDFNLNFIGSFRVNFEINYADVHQDKLYLLATSSDRQFKLIYVYDESSKMLDNIQPGNSEGLPFHVPISVTKMKVAEKFFVFLDGTKVLLMDRLDGAIKRTFSIPSSDFVLDSSNDRIMTYDGETEKLICFDFEGESFEISYPALKKFELVDFVQD